MPVENGPMDEETNKRRKLLQEALELDKDDDDEDEDDGKKEDAGKDKDEDEERCVIRSLRIS